MQDMRFSREIHESNLTPSSKQSDREKIKSQIDDFFANGGKIKSVGSEANANTESKKWTKYNKHNKNKG